MSLTTVYKKNGEAKGTVHVPSVMRYSPIRPDVVHFVHSNLAKNHRQAYGRFNRAGHQHSAESFGTGRAVARVPRVSGSGTGRNGQGAFANMTRKGRMFSPLKIWRRWHRMVNVTQRRYAVCAALAASAVPALVMARGHNINNVPEIPLVVEKDVETIKKTKEAVKLLKTLRASEDVRRAAGSRKIRAGTGKMRNRRYVQRRGVLVIHNQKKGLSRAIRNIQGAECRNVNRLNIKDLAPGGHIGRFILWTEGAYKKLDSLYGTRTRDSRVRKHYRHPTSIMWTTDLDRIVHTSKVRKAIKPIRPRTLRTPKTRRDLLLVRRVKKNTILNSKLKQYRKARLEKLRALKSKKPAPEKKVLKPRAKPAQIGIDGLPRSRKERAVYLRKQKEAKKARRGLKHKKLLEKRKKTEEAKKAEIKKRKEMAKKSRPEKKKKKTNRTIKKSRIARKAAKKAAAKTEKKE